MEMAPKSKNINRRKMNKHSSCDYKPTWDVSAALHDISFNAYVNCNFFPFNQRRFTNNTYPWSIQPIWNHNYAMYNFIYYPNGPVYNGIPEFNIPIYNRKINHKQNKNNNMNHKQKDVIKAKPSSELPESQDENCCINPVGDVKEEIDKPAPEITRKINTLVEENSSSPRKKKSKKSKHNKRRKTVKPTPDLSSNEEPVEAIVQCSNVKKHPVLSKYYSNRFSLFSKFDEGIQLDEESWYSVTPEKLAVRTARRCRGDVIVDGFCGAGGNCIQFAFFAKKVIAIDIDPVKIALAKNNAKVYGVEDRIEFICGNFLELAPTLQANVVFMSPPWGGPEYAKQETYDLEAQLLPVPFSKLIETARLISEDICIFLPRNICRNQIYKAAKDICVQIEESYIKKRSIGTTVYYNKLVKATRINKPKNKKKSEVKTLKI